MSGSIAIPSSKSQTLRALLFGSLSRGVSRIYNYLDSPDTLSMINACRTFGAKFEFFDTFCEIHGVDGKLALDSSMCLSIDAGNSGIVLRFCSAVGALSEKPFVVTGDYSVRNRRDMRPFFEAFPSLGVSITPICKEGFAPLLIKGPLLGGKAVLYGRDSQHVSALLIAAAFSRGETELFVKDPGELPWVQLTLNWLDRLNIRYEREGFSRYKLFGNASCEGFEYFVPGDLSSVAFPIAAALITKSQVEITNVDLDDAQGDKEIISVFQKMGAFIEINREKKALLVRPSYRLQGIVIDVNNFIDAIPALSVVACFAEGETVLKNGKVARTKESDRISAMALELKKMGADIREEEDGLIVRKSSLKGALLDSHNDHRVAMALAIAAMNAQGVSEIGPVECIDKTFPRFIEEFSRLGANIKIV